MENEFIMVWIMLVAAIILGILSKTDDD